MHFYANILGENFLITCIYVCMYIYIYVLYIIYIYVFIDFERVLGKRLTEGSQHCAGSLSCRLQHYR